MHPDPWNAKSTSKPLPTSAVYASEFFGRDAETVARKLLGAALVHRVGDRQQAIIITETEAYLGPHDLACHSARGRTPRTAALFGPPGTLYIYLVYGLHLMLNVVTGKQGDGAAVLIRSAGGVQGPGRLSKMIGLQSNLNGQVASKEAGLWFERRTPPSEAIIATPRIGVDYAGSKWSRRKLRFVLSARTCAPSDASRET
jgi:DNA-3-methyladenine glycosylase